MGLILIPVLDPFYCSNTRQYGDIDDSSDSNIDIISPGEARRSAMGLIATVTEYWSDTPFQGEVHWTLGSTSGEPLLVYDFPEKRPLHYLVPVLEPEDNEHPPDSTAGLISIRASTGEWIWYLEDYEFCSFPPITYVNALDILNHNLLSKGIRGFRHSDISRIIAVTMPNRELYWYLQIPSTDEQKAIDCYININNGSDIRIGEPHDTELGSEPDPMNHEDFFSRRNMPESHNITGNSLDDGGDWYHSQTGMYCGPASLQMAFDYYGPLVDQDDIADAGHYDGAQGVWPSDMVRAAHFSNLSTSSGLVLGSSNKLTGYPERSLGYAGFTHDWSDGSPDYADRLDHLKMLIANNMPPILSMWWDESHSALHYRVPMGYNNVTGEIICYEPNLNYKGQPGKNYHFNEDVFVNDLWKIHTGERWALMTGPWIVNVTMPEEVDEGTPFTISADVIYPCPYPFSGYPASDAEASLEIPGIYTIGGDDDPIKELNITTAPGNDTVRWLVTAPRTMIDITNVIKVTGSGNISGQVSSWWGSENYTDRIGTSVETNITIITHTPSITEITLPFTANKGTNITAIPFGWSDPDEDTPRFIWRWKRNGMNVSGENGPTYRGEKNKGDLIRVECTPFDGIYDGAMKSAEVLVVNCPPILNYSTDTMYMDEDMNNTDIDLNNIFLDIDGDDLSFAHGETENMNITILQNGTVMVEPHRNWNGNETVTFSADDGEAIEDTSILIIVRAKNDKPVLEHIGDQECHVGEWFNLTVEAFDRADGDELHFSDDTHLFDIHGDTGTINYLPRVQDMGEYHINITVHDEKGGIASEVALFSVININQPPVLASAGEKRVTDNFVLMFDALEDSWFNLSVHANDPDLSFPGKDRLTFATNLTDKKDYDDVWNFYMDNETGNISFLPDQEDVKRCRLYVNVTVEDMWGASDHVHLEITILNVNDPPPEPGILFPLPGTKHENATLKLIAKPLGDRDGDTLYYCWDMDSRDGLQADAVGSDTSVVFSQSGIYIITLVVSDGTVSSKTTVTVDITVPRPPSSDDDGIIEDDMGKREDRTWLPVIIIVFLTLATAGTYAALKKRKGPGNKEQ